MNLLKTGDLFLADCYPAEITASGVLKYFLCGEGWLKTKKYEVIENVNLPDRWVEISWLEIARMYNEYDIEVANVYAENKTAGIVSRQTARAYGHIYKKIQNIIPNNFNEKFFECLKCDYTLSCFGMFLFDIVETENKLAAIDSEYDQFSCTYKNQKNVSLKMYIQMKYGNEYAIIIDRLISDF